MRNKSATSSVLAENDEQVHGANFREIVFRAMKPEVLCVTLLRCVFLGKNARCVVDPEFVGAGACMALPHASEGGFRNMAPRKRTTGSGADEFGCAIKRHGLESVGVEWSDGTEDDEEESFVGRADPNGALSTN